MGECADTIFKGVHTGSHCYCCRKAVPLYEAFLNILLRFWGDEECHWMSVPGGSLQVGGVICDIQCYESMSTFIKVSQSNVCSALQKAFPP